MWYICTFMCVPLFVQVYIGPGQYFVTSDIGRGRMQWYAFLALPPGSKSREDNIQYLKDVSYPAAVREYFIGGLCWLKSKPLSIAVRLRVWCRREVGRVVSGE